jgi:hypothetical protein
MYFARVSHRGVPDERTRPHPHVHDTQAVQSSNRFADCCSGSAWRDVAKRFRSTKGSVDTISQQQLDCVGDQREFLVPSKQSLPVGLAAMQQRLSRSDQARSSDKHSITVDRLQSRTTAPHGITGPELERLSGAVRFMTLYTQPRRRGLWLATSDKGTERFAIASIWKRITRLQGQIGLRAYSAAVFETKGGLHAHIIFIGTREIAQRLQAADVRPVTDANGLVQKYLSKERTPQAGYGREHILGGRLKGSHRLQGGGDRVRLSRALERDAIEASYVDAWQHSNARRSPERRRHRPRVLTERRPVHRTALSAFAAGNARCQQRHEHRFQKDIR